MPHGNGPEQKVRGPKAERPPEGFSGEQHWRRYALNDLREAAAPARLDQPLDDDHAHELLLRGVAASGANTEVMEKASLAALADFCRALVGEERAQEALIEALFRRLRHRGSLGSTGYRTFRRAYGHMAPGDRRALVSHVFPRQR